MQNVFHNTGDGALVGPDWIERLKRVALESPLRRSRLCLHHSDSDALHEMIIVLQRECLFPPHHHPLKTKSYHMIEGRLAMMVFDERGRVTRAFVMTPPGQGGIVCYRMCAPTHLTFLPLDPLIVFHEVTNGPFVRGEGIIPDWAPSEPHALRAFLREAAIEAGISRELLGD